MQIIYRRLVPNDVNAMVPLVRELGYKTSLEFLAAKISLYQDAENKAWVADTDEGKLIGIIAIHYYDIFQANENYARIVSLVTLEGYRRHGVGKKLHEIALKDALNNGCSALEVAADFHRFKQGTQEFYESLGYEQPVDSTIRYFRKPLSTVSAFSNQTISTSWEY